MKPLFMLLLCLLMVACQPLPPGTDAEYIQMENEKLRLNVERLQAELSEAQFKASLLAQVQRAADVVAACENLSIPDWLCGSYTVPRGRAALDAGVIPAPNWEMAIRATLVIAIVVVFSSLSAWAWVLRMRLGPRAAQLAVLREKLAMKALELVDVEYRIRKMNAGLDSDIAGKESIKTGLLEEISRLQKEIGDLRDQKAALEQQVEFLRSLK